MSLASIVRSAPYRIAPLALVVGCGNSPPPAPAPTPTASTIAPSFGDVPDAAVAAAVADAAPPVDAAPAEPEVAVTVLAKGQHASAALTADGTHVYWVEDVEGSVTRVPKRGGSLMMFYSATTGAFASPSTIAIDEQDVYWTEHVKQDGPAGASTVLGRVLKQEKNGGKPTVVASGIRDELRSLAVDDKGVYWISGSSIMRAAKAGGGVTPLTLKLGDPTSVAGDGKFVYWTQTAPAEKGKDGGAVMRQPLTPGAKQEVLAAGQDKPTNVLVDDAGLCWITSASKVACMTKDKGAAPKVVGESPAIADAAIDAKFVYWLGGDGTVMRAPRDGASPPEKLASGQTNPVGISVDKTNVYWSTKGTEAKQFRDGTVVARAKP